MKNSTTRARLNLAVTQQVKDRLDRLVDETEAESVTEIVRRSLSLYDELIGIEKSGGRIILENDEGKRVVLALRGLKHLL